jgi:hypothetical protein
MPGCFGNRGLSCRGTKSSNPSPSSAESAADPESLDQAVPNRGVPRVKRRRVPAPGQIQPLSSPRTTAQRRQASKANYRSSQGDDHAGPFGGIGEADKAGCWFRITSHSQLFAVVFPFSSVFRTRDDRDATIKSYHCPLWPRLSGGRRRHASAAEPLPRAARSGCAAGTARPLCRTRLGTIVEGRARSLRCQAQVTSAPGRLRRKRTV